MEEAGSGASTLNASDDALSGSRVSAIVALAIFTAAPHTAPGNSHATTKWSRCMISERWLTLAAS